MGGLGKMLFALNLAFMNLNEWTSEFALMVVAGDIFFVLGFLIYFLWMRTSGLAELGNAPKAAALGINR